MKKYLSWIGSLILITTSISSVISCGFSKQNNNVELAILSLKQLEQKQNNFNLHINSNYRFIKEGKSEITGDKIMIPDKPSSTLKKITIVNPEYNGQDGVDHFVTLEDVPSNYNENFYGLAINQDKKFNKNWKGIDGEWEEGYNPYEIQYEWDISKLEWVNDETNSGFISKDRRKIDHQENIYEISIDGIAEWIQIKDYQLQTFIYKEINDFNKEVLLNKSNLEKRIWYSEQMVYLIGNYDLLGTYIPLLSENLDYNLDRLSGSNISYTKILNHAWQFYNQLGNYAEEKIEKKSEEDGYNFGNNAKFINDLQWINLEKIADGSNSTEFGSKWHEEDSKILDTKTIENLLNLIKNKIVPWFNKIITSYDDLLKEEEKDGNK